MNNTLSEKLTSGRWILTVMSGLCLFMLTLAFVWRGPEYSVSGEAIVGMISLVFTSYFNRKRNGDDGS